MSHTVTNITLNSTNSRRVRFVCLVVVKGSLVSIDTSVKTGFTGQSSERDPWFSTTSQSRGPSLTHITDSSMASLPARTFTLRLLLNFSFNSIFGGHKSFLWGHWYACFGLLVTSPLGFKPRVGSLIRTWWGRMCSTSLRFISGATPAGLLAASMVG